MSVLKWVTTLTIGSSALVATSLYLFQNNIIYASSVPAGSRTQVDTPAKYGLSEYEDVTLDTPDGESLHCYLIMQTKEHAAKRPTVLLFHANAGNMGIVSAHTFTLHICGLISARSQVTHRKSIPSTNGSQCLYAILCNSRSSSPLGQVAND